MFTRCYAFMYDRISRGSERAGLRDERPALRASRSAALPRTRARRGSEDREETGHPAVPLLLAGVPSEPSHPGRDHAFEAVRRGRSPWSGPECTRDRAADGGRPSHAERGLMATGRNTHAMTFTPLASWSRPVDGNHSQEIVSATT